MKYLRMFEAASGLFPKRIKVTLIDAATNSILGKYKIPAELLPPAFNRPTILEIDNVNWRVLQADPILADDFLFTKKLALQVQQVEHVNAQQLNFDLPTICSGFPVIGASSLYNDFTLNIEECDWRQIEFMPLKQSAITEEAIKMIEEILGSQSNPLLGYKRKYTRDTTAQPSLAIPVEKFFKRVVNPVWGSLFLNNHGLVHNGFSLRSDSHTYYGIIENGFIQTLCLNNFDYADDEFMRVLSRHELCLVDWCNASRISAEAGEKPASKYIII